VKAHDHHPDAAHHAKQPSAEADGAVGKQPLVQDDDDDPVATAAGHHKHHTANFYKTRVDQFVGDLFNTKVRAIDNFSHSLAKSGSPPHNLLGDAVAFAIGAAAGPFVDSLALGVIAAAAVKEAIPHFAGAVGKSLGGGSSNANPVEVATFATLYGHAINEHRSIVSHQLKAKIHDAKSGKHVVHALGGEVISGHLYLTNGQAGSLNAQTQRETLDTWTVAMQKAGDKKDHNQQGYSDPSTGQLHLDGPTLLLNGTFRRQGGEARMEGVGNAAAQLNGDRKLKDIKVQRTFNVRWDYPDGQGQFGLNISASGKMADDEFGDDDKRAAAMFYDGKDLFPVTSDQVKKDAATAQRDYRKGLHKIWNMLHDKTPHELGFSMKGD
jgi:hypothetical protein